MSYRPMDEDDWAHRLRDHARFLDNPTSNPKLSLICNGADLRSIVFDRRLDRAQFERCRFGPKQKLSGSMKECQFKGCLMEGVQITGSLQNANFRGLDQQPLDLTSATIERANGAHFHEGVIFKDTCLCHTSDSDQIHFHGCEGSVKLSGNSVTFSADGSRLLVVNCSGVDKLVNCNVTNSHMQLYNTKTLERVQFSESDLSGSSFKNSMFNRVTFVGNGKGISLTNVDFSGAHWTEDSTIKQAIVDRACFWRCKNLRGRHAATLEDIHGAERARYSWKGDVASWAVIRNIGSIPLFGVSSTALVLFWLFARAVEFYNRQLERLQGHGMDWSSLVDNLQMIQVSYKNGLLLSALLLLAFASGIYRFQCPSIVKEHTETEWRYKYRHQVIEYRLESYAYPFWRWLSAVLYLIGGLYVVGFLVCRIAWTLFYLLGFPVDSIRDCAQIAFRMLF